MSYIGLETSYLFRLTKETHHFLVQHRNGGLVASSPLPSNLGGEDESKSEPGLAGTDAPTFDEWNLLIGL